MKIKAEGIQVVKDWVTLIDKLTLLFDVDPLDKKVPVLKRT